MSKQPFKVDDTVYHPKFGKCTVIAIDEHSIHYPIRIKYSGNDTSWVEICVLSFKPWPEPCHERPLQDGWWIVTHNSTPHDLLVRHKNFVDVYSNNGKLCGHVNSYTFHKYLGNDWK